MNASMNTVASVFSVLALSAAASASITAIGGGDYGDQMPGWDQPPVTLGGWNITQYDTTDPFLRSGDETFIATSDIHATHTTTFDISTGHRHVGSSWATWSGGYDGSVYWTGKDANILQLTMSPGTVGFSLFFQPTFFVPGDFTLIGFDSAGNTTLVTQTAFGDSGATWMGFFTDGSTTIDMIEVRAAGDLSFAVGQFGYAVVPAPGAMGLLALAGLCGTRRRRE